MIKDIRIFDDWRHIDVQHRKAPDVSELLLIRFQCEHGNDVHLWIDENGAKLLSQEILKLFN